MTGIKGIGGHTNPNRGNSDDWLSPPKLVEILGPFDTDPCASPNQPWRTAANQITLPKNGLVEKWTGVVWCNPPYGPDAWPFLEKMAEHRNGIALVFARTETKGFHEHVWRKANSIFFFEGRLHFHEPVTGKRAKGNAGGPSVLIGYGPVAHRILRVQGQYPGKYIGLDSHTIPS